MVRENMSVDGWSWVSRDEDSSQFDGADERAVAESVTICKSGEQCKIYFTTFTQYWNKNGNHV